MFRPDLLGPGPEPRQKGALEERREEGVGARRGGEQSISELCPNGNVNIIELQGPRVPICPFSLEIGKRLCRISSIGRCPVAGWEFRVYGFGFRAKKRWAQKSRTLLLNLGSNGRPAHLPCVGTQGPWTQVCKEVPEEGREGPAKHIQPCRLCGGMS